MELFSDMLAPHSDEFGKIAGMLSCMHYLSGIFQLNDIRKHGSNGVQVADQFLGGMVISILSLKLGILMGDVTMIKINAFGFFSNLIFTILFYWYCSSACRQKIRAKFGKAFTFTIACLAYASYEDPAKLEYRFGILITSILVILVIMPLLNIGEIIAKKSMEGIAFPNVLSGVVVAASWALYGISIRNPTLMYQNLLLLLLSSIQLALFAIYPSKTNANNGSDFTHLVDNDFTDNFRLKIH